jgi:hypothetical protein
MWADMAKVHLCGFVKSPTMTSESRCEEGNWYGQNQMMAFCNDSNDQKISQDPIQWKLNFSIWTDGWTN